MFRCGLAGDQVASESPTGFVRELANSERAELRPIILGMRRRRNVRFRGSRKLAPPNPAKAGSSEAPGSGRCKGANRMIGVEARGLATVAQATGEGCLGNPRLAHAQYVKLAGR